MRLYAGSTPQFIEDTTQNQIAGKLKREFEAAFRYPPSQSEVRSWGESLSRMAHVVRYANLMDHGVILEYQLPLTSRRLDCMVMGRDEARKDHAVIVELKQWEASIPAEGDRQVVTFLGQRQRETLHPSVQVGQYKMYLQDGHEAFYEDDAVGLEACAYLHNYSPINEDAIYASKFDKFLEDCPVFNMDEVPKLRDFLTAKLGGGEGLEVLKRVERSKARPSKKLMEHVASVIKGKAEYVLLDEQLVVFDKVVACARRGFHGSKKAALIVRGGPGTGKSVIAINLMGELMKQGYNTHYATGSKAFTETLREVIGPRAVPHLRFFSGYRGAERNAVDVLICDEAHRIWLKADDRFTPKAQRSDRLQIQNLLDAAKVAVFFVDDLQSVRPNEIGTSEFIKKAAGDAKCEISEYELEAQFRCAGSEAFVNWVNNTLGIRKTANIIWTGQEGFDFRIFGSPGELDDAIRAKGAEKQAARLVAGFCWPWSAAKVDGTLVDDVQLGTFHRPWNAKHDAARLAAGIPHAQLWAYDPGGVNQVGCVYTAQGFEFDYVGVIWGLDLRYDLDRQEWVGDKTKSYDGAVKRSGDRFVELVKNTYRILISRGLKGCYVHFMDKDTERFVRSRMEAK
jgi:hypothetical protein